MQTIAELVQSVLETLPFPPGYRRHLGELHPAAGCVVKDEVGERPAYIDAENQHAAVAFRELAAAP